MDKCFKVTEMSKNSSAKETGASYGRKCFCSDNPGHNIWDKVMILLLVDCSLDKFCGTGSSSNMQKPFRWFGISKATVISSSKVLQHCLWNYQV